MASRAVVWRPLVYEIGVNYRLTVNIFCCVTALQVQEH